MRNIILHIYVEQKRNNKVFKNKNNFFMQLFSIELSEEVSSVCDFKKVKKKIVFGLNFVINEKKSADHKFQTDIKIQYIIEFFANKNVVWIEMLLMLKGFSYEKNCSTSDIFFN